MLKRTDKLLIRDIIECCESIFEYCGLMSIEEFMDNKIVQDAIVRNFEVIGEA